MIKIILNFITLALHKGLTTKSFQYTKPHLKLGINSIGVDVNPIARSISSFLTNPVNAEEFKVRAINLLNNLDAR